MKEIVEKTLWFYFTKMRAPTLEELWYNTESFPEKACCFVTLYINGEVHGSAGNIKEISGNLWQELIENTIHALTKDKRFSPLTKDESEKIQFRADRITERNMIDYTDISSLDPVKDGIIAIKRDYEKLAVILPNMSPKILTGNDFLPVLANKLSEKSLSEKNYIFYKISTQIETNY